MPWSFLLRRVAGAAILGVLAACEAPPLLPPAPAVPAPPAPAASVSSPPAPVPVPDAVLRTRARWVRADWTELPGFGADTLAQFWPALQASCAKPARGWNELCARALLEAPVDAGAQRSWLITWLQPWRLESPEGNAEGLITGYYEPLIEASRRPTPDFRVPLHMPPAELVPQRPFFTRQQLDSQPAAMAVLKGREIAYVEDPLDALVLQIQGSGRLKRGRRPTAASALVRLAFAGPQRPPLQARWAAG